MPPQLRVPEGADGDVASSLTSLPSFLARSLKPWKISARPPPAWRRGVNTWHFIVPKCVFLCTTEKRTWNERQTCQTLPKDETQYLGLLCHPWRRNRVSPEIQTLAVIHEWPVSEMRNVEPLNFDFKWNGTTIPKVPSVSQTSRLQRGENRGKKKKNPLDSVNVHVVRNFR